MAETSDNVKWWKTRRQNAKDSTLLTVKGLMLIDGSPHFYVMEYGKICAVQQGNPSIAPYTVDLDLFDETDRHYQIRLGHRAGGDALTQPDINALIASLKPVSHP